MATFAKGGSNMIFLISNLLIFVFNSCESVNLNISFSVVKRGEPNTYFGFSVAQHQILDEDVNQVEQHVYVSSYCLIYQYQSNRLLGPYIA